MNTLSKYLFSTDIPYVTGTTRTWGRGHGDYFSAEKHFKQALSARPLGQVLECQLLSGDGAFVYLCMWKAMGSYTQYGYYRTGLLKMQPVGLMI